MYFDSGSICDIYYGLWHRNCGSLQVDCLEFTFFPIKCPCKLPGQTRPVQPLRSLCIIASQMASPGSFIMHTYLHISHRGPMYPPQVDKGYAQISVQSKILHQKVGRKGKMDRRGCCKSYSKVGQLDVSISTSHRPDMTSDLSDS
jgi:hypothetical protein